MSEKPFPFLKFARALPQEVPIPIRVVGFGEIHADFSNGDAGDQANFVFVSVDPSRDTPDVIKRYVEAFDPKFIGLTGDDATLQKLTYALDGLYEKQKPNEGDPNSYVVAHTSFIYLFDANGKWKMKYPFGTPVDVLAADLKAQIQ